MEGGEGVKVEEGVEVEGIEGVEGMEGVEEEMEGMEGMEGVDEREDTSAPGVRESLYM